MRVGFAADHAGAALKAELLRRLTAARPGDELVDLGGDGSDPNDDYPDFAQFLVREGIDHIFDANSSFDRPLAQTLPSANFTWVIAVERWLRPVAFGAGRLGMSTLVKGSVSTATAVIAPAPSTRSSAGLAAGP